MPISFSCQSCGRTLRVKDDLVGKQIYCPDCKSILNVPHPEYSESEPALEALPGPAEDAYSARAEEALKPVKPLVRVEDDEDWDAEPRRPLPEAPTSGGPNIAMVLGGIGLIIGGGVFVLIGLFGGIWFIKLMIVLLIAGAVMFFRGLVGKTD